VKLYIYKAFVIPPLLIKKKREMPGIQLWAIVFSSFSLMKIFMTFDMLDP